MMEKMNVNEELSKFYTGAIIHHNPNIDYILKLKEVIYDTTGNNKFKSGR